MKKILYFIAACTFLMTACEKENEVVENTPYEKVTEGDTKYSYLKFLNVTPGSPVVNFYLDDVKFSANLSSSGVENSGYAYNGIFPDLGYAVTSPGTHKVTAKIVPSATADASLEVLNTTINPAPGKYYTVFSTGAYSATNKSVGPLLMLEDVRPALDTSKIYVRVANFYNGSTNLDLVKDVATGTKIVSNVAYGTASNWAEIPALIGGTSNSIKLFLNTTTTTTPLISAGTTLTLTKGRAYTLYTRGIVGNTTFPLALSFYTTFY